MKKIIKEVPAKVKIVKEIKKDSLEQEVSDAEVEKFTEIVTGISHSNPTLRATQFPEEAPRVEQQPRARTEDFSETRSLYQQAREPKRNYEPTIKNDMPEAQVTQAPRVMQENPFQNAPIMQNQVREEFIPSEAEKKYESSEDKLTGRTTRRRR